mmetsp:Transcript_59256/g.98153  ORF Transcript_59256/g.98153 Transcript_59256/m.98153 type:complete len:135 (-) Transcript_59256:1080-1484(-)
MRQAPLNAKCGEDDRKYSVLLLLPFQITVAQACASAYACGEILEHGTDPVVAATHHLAVLSVLPPPQQQMMPGQKRCMPFPDGSFTSMLGIQNGLSNVSNGIFLKQTRPQEYTLIRGLQALAHKAPFAIASVEL